MKYHTLIPMLAIAGMLAVTTIASAQSAQWNRELKAIAAIPTEESASDSTQLFDIYGVFTISTEPTSVPLDLSFEITFTAYSADQTVQVQEIVDIEVLPTIGICGGNNCGTCGGLYYNGVLNQMLCLEGCTTCKSLSLTTLIPSVPLPPGDNVELVAQISPAGGGLPEPDTSDDLVMQVFHGQEISWARRLDIVDVSPPSPLFPHYHDLTIRPAYEVNYEGTLNLGSMLVVLIDGVPYSSHMPYQGAADIAFVACSIPPTGKCNKGLCASGADVQSACLNISGGTGCTCNIWLSSVEIPQVAIEQTVQVMLVPLPGSLPELPGTNSKTVVTVDLVPPCPADLNADGTVNILDLLLMLEAWRDCPE